jgi:hypothetical protein
MPCSPLEVNRSFGATWRLRLQGWRMSQGRNQHEAGSKNLFLVLLTFQTWRRRQYFRSETLANFRQTTWCYILRTQLFLVSGYLLDSSWAEELSSMAGSFDRTMKLQIYSRREIIWATGEALLHFALTAAGVCSKLFPGFCCCRCPCLPLITLGYSKTCMVLCKFSGVTRIFS